MNSPGDQPDLDAAIRAIMAGRDLSALAEDLRRDRLPQAAPDGSRFGMHVNKPIKLPEPPDDPITLTVLVELEDANPEIWRRLELRGDQHLGQLHEVLQAAMGWNNSHLHRFNRPSERDYFLTEFDEHEGTPGTPEREVRLDQVLRQPGDSLNYEYDFGDGWEHVLRVIDVRTCATDDPVARCEAGERACPPDDIGGIHRWNELAAQLWPVEDLRNLKDQYGPGLPIGMDPNRFDLHETNQAIAAALEHAPAVSTYIEALDGAPTKIEPFEDLIRRCPPFLAREVGSLTTQALEPLHPTEAEVRAHLRPWQAVLDVAAPDGIPLTKAGWIAPSACEYIWHQGGLAWSYGKGNREQNTPEVHTVRTDCMDLRLLRKYKDRLLLTPVGRHAQADPQVLLRHIGEALRIEGERHVTDVAVATLLLVAAGAEFATRNDFEDDVARIMNALGWRLEGGEPIHRLDLPVVGDLLHFLRPPRGRLGAPPPTTPAARRMAQIALFFGVWSD